MSVRRLAFQLLLVVWVAAATPTIASAFVCTRAGPNSDVTLVWSSRQVPFVVEQEVIDRAGPGALAEVQGSFQTWSSVDCSDFELVFDGIVESTEAEFGNPDGDVNAVLWVESGWPHPTDAIAVTSSAFNTATGQLVDVDIELNGEFYDIRRLFLDCDVQARTMDLRNTLTHEVGHFLGLDHPPDTEEFEETTMYARAPLCETRKRTLAQDDIDGICFIYPEGAATQRCVTPDSGGCSHTPTSGPGAGWAWLVLASLLLARRRYS